MGMVFKIQRYCIQDGPGIRTTVFVKGCPLDCIWCHNPESKRGHAELFCHANGCVSCGACVATCPNGCHSILENKHTFAAENCAHCGACITACPNGALEKIGEEKTVSEVIAEVKKDRIFYETSGGGMTVSGGEPFAQPKFLLELLQTAKRENIHTAIETCGYTTEETLRAAAQYTDLFLFDIKETDASLHKQFTGKDNAVILRNLDILSQLHKPVVLRCPIVPGCNDRGEHLQGIAELANRYSNVVGVDIEPYHELGQSKQEELGKAAQTAFPTPEKETVAVWKQRLQSLCRCKVSVPAYD